MPTRDMPPGWKRITPLDGPEDYAKGGVPCRAALCYPRRAGVVLVDEGGVLLHPVPRPGNLSSSV